MRLRHTLVHHSPATAADIKSEAVTEESMAFESYQCFSVLPTETDVL